MSTSAVAQALTALRAGNSSRALRLLRRVIAKEPGHGDGWLNLAGCHVAAKPPNITLALAFVERALAIDPNSSVARRNAIVLARAQNDVRRLSRHADAALAAGEDSELR